MTEEIITVTEYVRPNGRQIPLRVRIRSEQAEYLQTHNIKLSFEKLNPIMSALYADTGKKTKDGGPIETILLLKSIDKLTSQEIQRIIIKIKEEETGE